MGEAYFYHLTRSPLEAVLPQLLERSLANGWRVVVRGRNPRRMEGLDQHLWTYGDQSFLPHGLSGGEHDAAQPVLLTCESGLIEGRDCLMSVEGADVGPEEISALSRTCVFFDGTDPAALERARAQWRALTAKGVKAKYWSEETGQWQMKAES